MMVLKNTTWAAHQVDTGNVTWVCGPNVPRQRVQWLTTIPTEVDWGSGTVTVHTIGGYFN